MPPPTRPPAGPDAGSEPPSAAPESDPSQLPRPDLPGTRRVGLGLDRLGTTQAIGGLVLGLIALFSSYDHISLGGYRIPLQQQWGILCIAASLATVLVDAQLASRSRFREAYTRLEERNRADQERDRADQERDRAAEARERQAESLERLDQTALLSARVQLDPNPANRERLQVFLNLIDPTRSPRDEPL